MNPYTVNRLSVVIPVYNEQDSLPELLLRTRAACEQLPCSFEIILVDDGSRDRSPELLREAAADPGSPVVAVILNRNYGQHAAVMAGFEQCTGDLVITLDADLQNPPEEIPGLVNVACEGYDVVGTVRQRRQDSALRRLPSRLINLAALRSTGVAMTDYGCMLRAYRRVVVDAMLKCHEHSTFIPILANSFARYTCEIPVSHAAREHGESKYGFMKLINLMFDLITTMSTAPLRLLSLFGAGMALTGFAFGVLLLVLRLANGPEWAAQGVFVLFAVLFIFTGAQFVGLGLLGEYLGRVYHDVRAHPRFFVEQIVRSPAAAMPSSVSSPDIRLQ
jgi:undecaprenyl-phosphate 4-deoxy-4-formamido-L-arabinose transferase